MEQLRLMLLVIGFLIACCVMYTGIQLITWVISLFGGVCIGC